MRPWDRKLWGVVRRRPDGALTGLLGEGWDARYHHMVRGSIFAGQRPTRALLFCTRREALAWCSEHGAVFRPVRVRERVTVQP